MCRLCIHHMSQHPDRFNIATSLAFQSQNSRQPTLLSMHCATFLLMCWVRVILQIQRCVLACRRMPLFPYCMSWGASLMCKAFSLWRLCRYKLIEEKLRLSQYLEWTFVSCTGPMKVSSTA